MYRRYLNLSELLQKKSHFLFGPRSTGKTTLIQNQLPSAVVFDLLERDTFRRLIKDPGLLSKVDQTKYIVIDEIQKIPTLLDEVHRLIQKNNTKFLLTGSSARKLKRGAANLLAGRAWEMSLLPLTFSEIPDFNLLQYINRGGLPHIYDSEDAPIELSEYISLYLREEIAAEALTRNIEAFSSFLDLVGRSNGLEVSYQSFANDCGVSINTIKNYFEILEDTLIGFPLKAFTKTKKRKAITRSKFYLFDVGVVNCLKHLPEIQQESTIFGEAFEHFIVNEVRAYLAYSRSRHEMHYWRSKSQIEIDLILPPDLAIEIKATKQVQKKHVKGLISLKEEGLIEKFIIVSQDRTEYIDDSGIIHMHWKSFLNKLWQGELIS